MVDYATLEQVRAWSNYGTSDTKDDADITSLITQVSATFDRITGRVFAPASDTIEYFEYCEANGYDLFVGAKDQPLLSITSLTNADGTTIASSEYFLLPRGASRFHTIRLKQASTVSWTDVTDGYIEVNGKWGWSTTVPDDITESCIEAVLYILKGKKNVMDYERPQVSPNGMMLLPKSLPQRVWDTLNYYKKKV